VCFSVLQFLSTHLHCTCLLGCAGLKCWSKLVLRLRVSVTVSVSVPVPASVPVVASVSLSASMPVPVPVRLSVSVCICVRVCVFEIHMYTHTHICGHICILTNIYALDISTRHSMEGRAKVRMPIQISNMT